MSDYYEHLEAAWNDLSKEDKEKFISSNIRQQQPIPQDILPIKEDGEDELWKVVLKIIHSTHRMEDALGKLNCQFHITRKTPNQ